MGKQADMTQMNIRIPVDLKRDGDSVLARFERTPSDVIRAVWSYMALHGKLPDCILDRPKAESLSNTNNCETSQAALLEELVLSTGISAENFRNINRTQAQEEMYEEMLAEYEALND